MPPCPKPCTSKGASIFIGPCCEFPVPRGEGTWLEFCWPSTQSALLLAPWLSLLPTDSSAKSCMTLGCVAHNGLEPRDAKFKGRSLLGHHGLLGAAGKSTGDLHSAG